MPYAQTLMTSDATGTYRGVYTYGLERISESDQVSVEGVPNDPLYYLYDGRGSVTQIVNTANTVKDKYRYTPFGVPMPGGQLTPNTRLFNNPYGYNGEDYDIESGLQFLRARYYNPETARFISRDSYLGDVMEPLSLNRYAYTSNNPVMNVDPSGHTSKNLKPTLQKNLTYNANAERLQLMLNSIGYDIGVDGKFGGQTDAAVRDFQNRSKIGVDGVVGNVTWAKLEEVYNNVLSTGITPGKITIPKSISTAKPTTKNTSSDYVASKVLDTRVYNDVGCGILGDISSGSDTNVSIYTWEEADKYINERVFGISVGHELYSASEISDLPEQITYEKDGYTYTYMLDEHHEYFMGGKLPTLPDYKTQDGKILSFKQYEYKLAYTDEPEVLTGTVYIGGLGGNGGNKGLYSNIPDSKSVGPGKKFTPSQKEKIIKENMERNGGVVKSDLSGKELSRPQQSKSGVTPDPNEWQIDHIDPKSKGGSNSNSNAQVLSREENRAKSNK